MNRCRSWEPFRFDADVHLKRMGHSGVLGLARVIGAQRGVCAWASCRRCCQALKIVVAELPRVLAEAPTPRRER